MFSAATGRCVFLVNRNLSLDETWSTQASNYWKQVQRVCHSLVQRAASVNCSSATLERCNKPKLHA